MLRYTHHLKYCNYLKGSRLAEASSPAPATEDDKSNKGIVKSTMSFYFLTQFAWNEQDIKTGSKMYLKSKPQAKLLTQQAIDLYNNRRPHLSLKMKTPQSVYKRNPSYFCNWDYRKSVNLYRTIHIWNFLIYASHNPIALSEIGAIWITLI